MRRRRTITELSMVVAMPNPRLGEPVKVDADAGAFERAQSIADSLGLGVQRSATEFVVKTDHGKGWIVGARRSLFALESYLIRLKEQWRANDEQ